MSFNITHYFMTSVTTKEGQDREREREPERKRNEKNNIATDKWMKYFKTRFYKSIYIFIYGWCVTNKKEECTHSLLIVVFADISLRYTFTPMPIGNSMRFVSGWQMSASFFYSTTFEFPFAYISGNIHKYSRNEIFTIKTTMYSHCKLVDSVLTCSTWGLGSNPRSDIKMKIIKKYFIGDLVSGKDS